MSKILRLLVVIIPILVIIWLIHEYGFLGAILILPVLVVWGCIVISLLICGYKIFDWIRKG